MVPSKLAEQSHAMLGGRKLSFNQIQQVIVVETSTPL